MKIKSPLNKLLADNRGRGTFRIENSAADEATIYLYDVIVSDSYWGGVSAIDFVKALAETTAGTIHLRINSPGGEVFAAQAMVQAIREKPAKCIAHVDGVAASCASWLALAADETVISQGGMVMIHNATTFAGGNAADLRESADLLDKIDGILVASYAKETGQSAEQIAAWMAAETWFNAEEAVANGFADRIAEVSPKNLATWNFAAYANAPAASRTPPRNEATPDLSIRQGKLYEALESIAEELGPFDQTSGKDGAHYMASSPFTGQGLQCANCNFYQGPRACEIVAGDISPSGVCKLWLIPERLITTDAQTNTAQPVNLDQLRRRLRLSETQTA